MRPVLKVFIWMLAVLVLVFGLMASVPALALFGALVLVLSAARYVLARW